MRCVNEFSLAGSEGWDGMKVVINKPQKTSRLLRQPRCYRADVVHTRTTCTPGVRKLSLNCLFAGLNNN